MGDGRNTEHIWRRGSRLIWRSLRAYPWLHTTAMVGALGFVAASIGGAWVLRAATDDLVIPAFDDGTVDRSDVWVVMGLIVVVSVGRGLGVMMRRWYLSLAENSTQRDWRRALVNHYLDVPLRFHRERPTGELLAHADIDLTTATMVLKPLAFSVSVLALVIAAVVTLFIIHPLVALFGIVLFPLLVVMSQIYTSRVEAPSARAQQAVGEVASVAHESFEGALVVKTLGREAAEVERLRRASATLRTERLVVGRIRAVFEPSIDALPNIGVVLLLLIGSWLVSRGDATPGDLVLAAVVFGLLATPLRVFGFFLEEMPRSVVALDRVDKVMAQPVEQRAGTATVPAGPVDVAVHGLVVGYGEHHVLRGVDLEVAAGTTAAVVGATGSGKSTLLEAVAGVLDRTEGTIAIGGVDIADVAADDWTTAVAIAFQESFLFTDTIVENVALGAVGLEEVHRTLAIARADGFVADLADAEVTVVGERGTTLSGGQRQRVALARALARRPQVLLLDDATSAVDPLVEAEILDALRAELDMTVLVVAHRISTILLADNVVYLDDGQVVATGTHEELLRRDDYQALVTAYEQGEGS
ncbi:MAG: ABC transporter ATP-binding protein/permease [Acidimicrobiales bacterium]|nr:ABC transporter ATP-binding protein/permease [Acidimicrobiales bacterium]